MRNYFQIAVTLKLLANKEWCTPALVCPGDGKSFIIMMMALYYVKNNQKVVICLINEMLVE